MVGVGRLFAPEPIQSPTSTVDYADAAPQCISGRTSYLRVRLAFHLYPQLIQSFCNRRRFGPPRIVTSASPWPWVAHPVSGLPPATRGALFRLAFAPAPPVLWLNLATGGNSSAHSSIGTRSGAEAPSHCLKAHGFRNCFTPLPGCFSPFPHGTCSLSVTSSI